MPSEASGQGQLPNYGPQEFADALNVSRETMERLEIYEQTLREWNAIHNLVSKNSLAQLWHRHFLDSAQLTAFIADNVHSLVDLGSGAGFPGLVLAALLTERQGFRVVLYEATGKKCRFLEAVAERMNLSVEIRNGRVEEAPYEVFDLVTARALAPLPNLLAYAQRFFGQTTVALFLKGQNVASELTKTHKSWKMVARQHPSITDPSGVILEVRELQSVREN